MIFTISMVFSNPFFTPFKYLLAPLGFWGKHSTSPSHLGVYIIALSYAVVLYIILSGFEARKRVSITKTSSSIKKYKITDSIQPTISKLIFSLTPLLMPISYVFLEFIFWLEDLMSLPVILEFIGSGAFSIVEFIIDPFSAPFAYIFPPLGLWDKWYDMPSRFGIYLIGNIYTVIFYFSASLVDALSNPLKHKN